MFTKFRKLLDRTSEKIAEKITKKDIKKEDIEDILWEMEIELVENNVSLDVAENIIHSIENELVGKVVERGKVREIVEKALRKIIDEEVIEGNFKEWLENTEGKKPLVILFFGFNGTGKTTTIAKLAYYLKSLGKSLVFAAGDTFRSAAIEQLEAHAKKLEIRVIKQQYGSDSAAVIYDAINYAKSKGIDIVLADTAGRAPTDKNLIEELRKIVRVINPDLKVLVLESLTGNDIVEQSKMFAQAGVDAVILTKYDVDDKKGAVLSVSYTLKKPILFLGTGQDYEDLKEFKKAEYLKDLLG